MTGLKESTDLQHLISPYSISVYGSAVGHSNISDDALVALSYNVTYKLYELLKDCKTEMNVYKQSYLSATILSNVFQNSGIPPMLGNKVIMSFANVPNTDMSVFHLPKIDLVAEAANVRLDVDLEPMPFVKGLYVSPLLKINGVFSPQDVKIEPKADSDEPSSSEPTSCNSSVRTLKKTETDYFLVVSGIILNSNGNLFKIIIEDLKTNPRLEGVYHTLLNLVGNSIKYFNCIGMLIDRLLRTVEALLDNPYVDPSSSRSVDDTINTLCTCILDSKIANDCDDFPYRRRASYLLMRALNTWTISESERQKILNTLDKTLKSPEKISLKLNYSILMMFYGLGCNVLDSHFWPVLNKYLNVLTSLDEIISGKRSLLLTTDICHVKSALLLMSGILYRNFWVQDESIQRLHLMADVLLYTYLGEAINPIRAYAIPKSSPLFTFNSKGKSQKEESIGDVRKNYRKMHMSALRKKYPIKNISVNSTYCIHSVSDVFEKNFLRRWDTPIVFNFIGSNQISYEELRIKKVDQRYNVQCRQLARPFLKYEKRTRCIKYCKNKKSCVGDIYLLM